MGDARNVPGSPAPAAGDERKGPRPLNEFEEYELKLDEQVQNFLEIGQRLAFYVVAAAVGSLGYTLTHAAAHPVGGWFSFVSVLLGGIAALLTVAFTLLSLWYQIASYRTHLSCRTRKLRYENLPQDRRDRWDLINRRSRRLQTAAFVGLTASIVLQAAYFTSALKPREAARMHHFGEDTTFVIERDDEFLIIAKNKVTNRAVTVAIPKAGILETPGGVVNNATAQQVGREIAHVLREHLK